ncbi:hypothetical protein K458DRAFT_241900, partial [Lentithecium fluviatile CBS 122367]
KYVLDDPKDLAALRPPADSDALSTFLRDHWPFKGTNYPDPRDATQHFLATHVRRTVLLISTFIAAALLIGVIVSLYFVRPASKLGMIAAFTTLFAASIGSFTSAKRQEVFAASAAYAAVLVVLVSG